MQAAALAALCFIPVVAAEPQLLLPLMLSFLVFLMLVRSHRTTLLLIPLPAASVCAPTLVNTVRFAGAGTWRQIFGSVILPSSAHDGHPMIANLSDIVSRAFGVAVSGEIWQYVAAAMLALIVLLAAVSLFLPFVLRVSRMMWSWRSRVLPRRCFPPRLWLRSMRMAPWPVPCFPAFHSR